MQAKLTGMATRGTAPAQGERTTPHRRTHLILDPPDKIMVELPFTRTFILDQMYTGDRSAYVNIHFLPGVGWELKPYQVTEWRLAERTEAQSGVQRPVSQGGNVQTGNGWNERDLTRAPSDLPGALAGASAGLAGNGERFIERTVTAGTDWGDQNLAGDQTAFPGPTAEENLAMDRVAVLNQTFDGTQPWVFRFSVPGNARQAPQAIKRFMFSAPAGYHNGRKLDQADEKYRRGTGRYQVTFYGDGLCGISELTEAAEWTLERKFRYAPSSQVTGRTHTIYVRPVARKNVPNGWLILFKCESGEGGQASGMFNILASFRSQAHEFGPQFVYRVPQKRKGEKLNAQPSKPRVDARRDQRGKYQISVTHYPVTGTLKCDPFSVPFWPTQTKPLIIAWVGEVPTGCSITCAVYDARTDTPLTSAGAGGPNWAQFNIAFGQDYFYVLFTLTSDNPNHLKTPILTGYRAQRNGRLANYAGENEDVVPYKPVPGAPADEKALLQCAFGPIHVANAEGDPSQLSANVTVVDLIGRHDMLQNRGDIPVRIETEYHATDPSKRSVLFDGYVTASPRVQRGRGNKRGRNTSPAQPDNVYPSRHWEEIQLTMQGKWMRIAEQVSNVKINWHWPDPDDPSGAPFKATTAVRYMLNWCGFPMAELEAGIPDLPIRLWPTDDEMDLFLEPGAPIWDYILRILKDYLGAGLVWDPNCGTAGLWRLIRAARPPYKRLARFTTTPPTGLGQRLVHNLDAWGTTTEGARQIPNVPVLLNPTKKVIKPEFNCVLVTGVALGDWSQYGRLTQWAVNPASFNFYDGANTADPTSPDYLSGRVKPGFLIDPGLNTPEAVRWAARRFYDQTCRGYQLDVVTAPLVLVDDPDDVQLTRKRPLRFYDPVVWRDPAPGAAPGDEKTWLVRTCTIDYRRDTNQMATYELQKPVGPYAD